VESKMAELDAIDVYELDLLDSIRKRAAIGD
jgi:hypothetical protein